MLWRATISPAQWPNSEIENHYRNQGNTRICGIDEAGRGALAGPVTAAAVMFRGIEYPEGLNDSKQLTPARRDALYEKIKDLALVSYAHVSVGVIDQLNILNASMRAMVEASRGLASAPDFALIDGNRVPDGLQCEAMAVVKGDQKSVSIAAASIVAKVERDKLMVQLSREHQNYAWASNKGYGTREHLQLLHEHGPTAHHRKSFLPVRTWNLG